MSKTSVAEEPSMEDILASIRKIITDDAPTDSKPVVPETKTLEPEIETTSKATQDKPLKPLEAEKVSQNLEVQEKPIEQKVIKETNEDDIFELTEDMVTNEQLESSYVEDDSDIMFLETEQTDVYQEDVIEVPNNDKFEDELPSVKIVDPLVYVQNEKVLQKKQYKPLLDSQVDAAISSQFSALSNIILNNNARTLDDIVSEMLRPMLKSWLDTHLPIIVENIVREEIERVTRGVR